MKPSERWRPPARARVLRVRERLRAVYGIPRIRPHGHPIAELVLTVLSQSTNDRNRDVAYLALRERFATWQDVMCAPAHEIEEAIRPGGISKVKSQRIKAILTAIAERGPTESVGSQRPNSEERRPPKSEPTAHARARVRARRPSPESTSNRPQEPSLDWLPDVPLVQARDYLVELPGVGRKTAACVLLFAFGLREVPVDTHVSRVGTRLRLLQPEAPFHQLHDQMLALTPPGQELELHVNLLRHGRRTCHARRPDCANCALARMCPSRGLFD